MTTANIVAKVVLVPEEDRPAQSDLIEINEHLSFRLAADGTTRTLSSIDFGDTEAVEGFLYAPSLDPDDACLNDTESIIPHNVTRQEDLPESGYNLIALAPWVSVNCTESFIDAATRSSAKALVFFQPGDDAHLPPPVSDEMWEMGDGGKWKNQVVFPIYAIPGPEGATLLSESAQYSGGLADSEHGAELAKKYDATDSARLFISIESDNESHTLPNLWIFLLGVLGILLAFVISSSVAMRLVQRRRRNDLRQRLAVGEVDLESIGVRKLKVPRSTLNKMPLYIYTENDPSTDPPTALGEKAVESGIGVDGNVSPSATATARKTSDVEVSTKGPETEEGQPASEPPPTSQRRESRLLFSQSTCPICLTDYVPLTTNVRELPCRHIFHPECIDSFLIKTSSLCPMCKKCALPVGFCPEEVTNVMVYRERIARRVRERNTRPRDLPRPIPTLEDVLTNRDGYVRPVRPTRPRTTTEDPPPIGRSGALISSGFRLWGRPVTRPDMSQASRSVPSSNQPDPVEEDQDDDDTHQEQMRRRAAAMLGPHEPDEHERDEESIPKWRRFFRRFFPGFR